MFFHGKPVLVRWRHFCAINFYVQIYKKTGLWQQEVEAIIKGCVNFGVAGLAPRVVCRGTNNG
ncbi:hypothetical protein C7N43_08700 [Sphingobacteriales bacterium UPWRP_1]|nr:hypothetical protein C7N43_08700 [Sphingobacteriales bacterium UPWRP_1]